MGMIKSRLGMMMFLQYAVWGIWLPVLSLYLLKTPEEGGLGFSGAQLGTLMGLAASIGAISAPFICSLADRHFSAQKFLAALLLLGGIVKYCTALSDDYNTWLVLSIAYSVLYMPTISLTNSIAFANLEDKEKDFPYVRVWGTIGWIAASWLFPMIYLQTDLEFQALPPFLVGADLPDSIARLSMAIKVSGIISILYAGYCFMLPNTPPKTEVKSIAVFKAFKMLKHPSILFIIMASLPISIIHQIYFIEAGPYLVDVVGLASSKVGPAMTVGQVAEIAVLAFLGLFIKRLGFRFTLMMGGLGYALRYFIWGAIAASGGGEEISTFAVYIAVLSQALHGFCFACFFAASFIYVDRIVPDDIRNSAQAVFGIIILGVGPVFSGYIMGQLSTNFGDGLVVTDFAGMWYALSMVAMITTFLLAFLFKDESGGKVTEDNATKSSQLMGFYITLIGIAFFIYSGSNLLTAFWTFNTAWTEHLPDIFMIALATKVILEARTIEQAIYNLQAGVVPEENE